METRVNFYYQLLQSLDLAFGRSSCAIQSVCDDIRTVQTTAEGTPYSVNMNAALCDF